MDYLHLNVLALALVGTAGKFNLPTTDTLTGRTIVYNDQPSSNEFAFYRLGTVTFDSATTGVKPVEIERIQRDYFYNIDRSDLTTPSENYPVYLYEGVNTVFVKPTTITANVETTFLRKPVNPVWGFYC